MRVLLTFSVLFIGLVKTYAQQPFTRAHGGFGYDFGAEVVQLPNQNFLVVGTSSSFDDTLSSQILLYEADSFGLEQWRKTIGGRFADVAESMVESADGNYLIAGYTETVENSYQVYALKVNQFGDTVWTRNYGGSGWDFCKQVIGLSDGGFALVGQTFSEGAGNGDFYLVRIDSEGDTLWTKTFGGSDEDGAESIAEAIDGGFFLAGYTMSFGAGKKDMYVVRTDSEGDTLWTRTFGGVEDDICLAVAATADGGYVLGGGTYNNTQGELDPILRKEGGVQQWVRTEVKQGDDYILDLIVEPGTQNVTAVGQISEGTFGESDGRILRYGADGVWNGVAKTHGSQGEEHFVDVKLTADNGYIMVGTTDGYLNRFDDVWLVKADNSGLSGVFSGIDEVELNGRKLNVRFAPNPSSLESSFLIDGFDLIQEQYGNQLTLLVFNSVGQQVLNTSVNGNQERIDLSNLSSGIHYYQLIAESSVLTTGKLVKID